MGHRIIGWVNPDGSGKGNWSGVDRRIQRLPYSWRQAARNDDPLQGLSAVRIIAELIAGIVIMTALVYGMPFILWLFFS